MAVRFWNKTAMELITHPRVKPQSDKIIYLVEKPSNKNWGERVEALKKHYRTSVFYTTRQLFELTGDNLRQYAPDLIIGGALDKEPLSPYDPRKADTGLLELVHTARRAGVPLIVLKHDGAEMVVGDDKKLAVATTKTLLHERGVEMIDSANVQALLDAVAAQFRNNSKGM